jgi:hypothetical protein
VIVEQAQALRSIIIVIINNNRKFPKLREAYKYPSTGISHRTIEHNKLEVNP